MNADEDIRLSLDECFLDDCHEAELFLDVLNPGDKIDGWVVTACVAFGGTSEVYRAVRENDKSSVASIKVLCDDQASARERFKYEVRILSESNTAALPSYLSSGEVDGHPYVITEYLEPIDLPSEEKEIKRYLIGVCNCVQVLHAAGIVHRDIKPHNVMRRKNGDIVLIDLGLAKDVASSTLPTDGVSIVDGNVKGSGTPGYAAPEQFQGGAITRQTDIYGIGMLAYHCFVDTHRKRRQFEDPIPKHWQSIVHRAICGIASERYESVSEMASAIRRVNRKPKVVGVVGLLALATIIGAAFVSWWHNAGREISEWDRLCEVKTVERIEKKLLSETVETNKIGRMELVQPVRRVYSNVVHRVETVVIDLKGRDLVFANPIRLDTKAEYLVQGPGRIAADFSSVGKTAALIRLKDCHFVNTTSLPLERGKIKYSLEGNAKLQFTAISRPTKPEAFAPYIADFDGFINKLEFKGDEEKFKKSRHISTTSYEYHNKGTHIKNKQKEKMV